MAISTVSASDADALRASRRGGVLLLVGVAGLAIAAAVGTASLEEGVGRPEEPARVMMVTATQSDAAAELVRKGGFEVESATLDEWGVQAVDALDPELLKDLDAHERVMRLADERGVGFLVTEQVVPEAEAPGVSGEALRLPGVVRWTVQAVGDLAKGDEGKEIETQGLVPGGVVQAEGIGALQALFEQPRLHKDRDSLRHNPSLKELQLQKSLDWGQAMVDRVESLEALAMQVQGDVDQRLQEHGVKVIKVHTSVPAAQPDKGNHYSGGAVPLADGGALLVTRRVTLKSFDASTLDYDLGPTLELHRWEPATANPKTGEVPEFSTHRLAELKVSTHPTVRVSERGDAWVVDTRFDAPHVFGLEPGPSTEAHSGKPSFQDRGPVAGMAPDEAVVGEPYRDGRVARVTGDGASAWVRIYAPNQKKAAVEFPPIAGYTLKNLRWLNVTTVVALAKAASPSHDDLIVFGRTDAPEHWYAVDGGDDWRVEGAPVYGIRMSALTVSVARDGKPASPDLAVKLESRAGYRIMRVKLEAFAEPSKRDKPDALNLLPAPASIAQLDKTIPRTARGLGLWSTAAGAQVVVTWMDETDTGRQVFARVCTPPSETIVKHLPEAASEWSCEQHVLTDGAQVRDAAARPLVGGEAVVFNSQVPVSVTERKVTRARWALLPEQPSEPRD